MAKIKAPPAPARLQIEYWPVDKPIPYAKNARIISEEAVEVLARSLKQFGWKQPIVVDEHGVIVVGHTRLRAAKKLGQTEVPVTVARDLTPDQIRQYRIMDNRSAQNTTWDGDMLKEELGEMAADLNGDVALLAALTGFEDSELDAVIGTLATDTPGLAPSGSRGGDDDNAPAAAAPQGKCSCPRCGFSWNPDGKKKANPDPEDEGKPAPAKRKRIDIGEMPDE